MTISNNNNKGATDMYELAMTYDTERLSEFTTDTQQRRKQEFEKKYGGELRKLALKYFRRSEENGLRKM